MKNSFFRFCLAACISLFSPACSNTEKLQGNEFLVEGKLSGVEDGIVVRIGRVDGMVSLPVKLDTVMNGRFTLRGEAESDLEQLEISAYGKDIAPYPLYVWVMPGAKVKIKGKGKIIPLWDVKSSVPYQKEENRFINNKRDLIIERSRISLNRNELFEKIAAASSEEEAAEYRHISNNILLKEIMQLSEEDLFWDMSTMEKMDISPVWLKKMQHITQFIRVYDNLRPKVWELFGRMSEEDKNTPYGTQIIAALTPYNVVGVGDNIADANLLDINGNTKRLSDYLDKYLLLDFWSLGCGPCIMAFPTMKEISETYRDKLTIISISIDPDAIWKKAMDMHNTPWVNLRDPNLWSGLSASYGVLAIPNYVMISPEGKIIDTWAGFSEGFLKMKVSENIN